MNDYFKALKNYAVLGGRSTRKEFWYFVLFNLVAYYILWNVDIIIDFPASKEKGYVGMLGSIFTFAILIPTVAVSVRRLHDTTRSGWWVFLGLIPFISIIFLVFMVQDSQSGENQYGPNPKKELRGAD